MRIFWCLGILSVSCLVLGCGEASQSDDKAAKAAFKSCDGIIETGNLGDLSYTVKDCAVKFENRSPYTAVLEQQDENKKAIRVNFINAQTTTQAITDASRGIETHLIPHQDAVYGKIYFQGKNTIIAEGVQIIAELLAETSVVTDFALCFFQEALTHSSYGRDSAEKDVRTCAAQKFAESIDGVRQSAMVERIGKLTFAAETPALEKQIHLRVTVTP